jgi:ubiquinone/menaquinone biosynthesis C-methylase UbiE
LEVVELACGTGYWTELLASSAAWVFATDINEEVLTLTRAKPVDRRRVVFQRELAHDLGFPDSEAVVRVLRKV